MYLKSVLVAAALLSASLSARADVIYTYAAPSTAVGSVSGSFTIDSPSILSYVNNIGSGVPVTTSSEFFYYFAPGYGQDLGTINAISFTSNGIIALTSGNLYENLFSGHYDLGTNGVYTSGSGAQTATFTVSGITQVAPTPEPSSLALLGTGLLGVIGVARKRLHKR